MSSPCLPVFVITLVASGAAAQQRPPVQVVQNDKPSWIKGREWRVADKPLVDLGVAEGDPAYELSGVRGVLRLNNGTVVVANQQTELRYYRDGKHVTTAGRRGDGPGEFFQIQGLTLLRDGNIGVNDFRHGIQVYSPNGEFVRLIKLPASARIAIPSVVFDDGSILMGDWPQGRRGATESYTDSMTLIHVSPGGAADTIGRFPASRFAPHPRFGNHQSFGPVLRTAAGGQILYLGFPEKWEVTQYSPRGNANRVIRRAWQPIEITAAERQAYREAMINMPGEGGRQISPQLRAQRESMYGDESFAKTLPAYDMLMVDRAGNLWAREPARPKDVPSNSRFHDTNHLPQQWSVFDPTGRWLGQVATPPNFWVFDIGSDYIVGLWRDELDVEHVRLYRLQKPSN